jgi:hypothetical protein
VATKTAPRSHLLRHLKGSRSGAIGLDRPIARSTHTSHLRSGSRYNLQPELVIGNATGGAGTRTYTFDLALDSAFQQIALSETGVSEALAGSRWRVTRPLEADTKYYWRVAAVTSAGAGPFSAVSGSASANLQLRPADRLSRGLRSSDQRFLDR